MNIPNHVEIDEMEELRMLENAVASLASQKLGWKDDLARARISVKMTQVKSQVAMLLRRCYWRVLEMKCVGDNYGCVGPSVVTITVTVFISRSWCYTVYQKKMKKNWGIVWIKLTVKQMPYWVFGSSPLQKILILNEEKSFWSFLKMINKINNNYCCKIYYLLWHRDLCFTDHAPDGPSWSR